MILYTYIDNPCDAPNDSHITFQAKSRLSTGAYVIPCYHTCRSSHTSKSNCTLNQQFSWIERTWTKIKSNAYNYMHSFIRSQKKTMNGRWMCRKEIEWRSRQLKVLAVKFENSAPLSSSELLLLAIWVKVFAFLVVHFSAGIRWKYGWCFCWFNIHARLKNITHTRTGMR